MPVTNPPAHHGKSGLLYISTAKAGALAQLALISEWSLDMATDKVETTALGDTNKTYVQGLKDVKGSFTGFFNDQDDALFDAADSPDGVMILLYPVAGLPIYWTGPAWLDASIKGSVTTAVGVTGTFSANGAWTRQST